MNDKRQFRTVAGLRRRGDSWTPLLGRFMLVVTWENVLEHVAGASDDPPDVDCATSWLIRW
jgi:hypothetical protein